MIQSELGNLLMQVIRAKKNAFFKGTMDEITKIYSRISHFSQRNKTLKISHLQCDDI